MIPWERKIFGPLKNKSTKKIYLKITFKDDGFNWTYITWKSIASKSAKCQWWTKSSTSTCACVISYSCWPKRTSSIRHILLNWRYHGGNYSVFSFLESVFGKFFDAYIFFVSHSLSLTISVSLKKSDSVLYTYKK